ncbi:unnamed protein product, partial [Timema podura]|nr:unnamed protein product [Timema podura]
ILINTAQTIECNYSKNALRHLVLSSASLIPIFWDGVWEGESCGVASQPTKVSFRASKNSFITDTVDGASYRTEVKEGFGNQINLCRDRGLNPGALAQESDTLPLDHQLRILYNGVLWHLIASILWHTSWFYSVVGLKTQSQAKQHYTHFHDS